MRNWKTSLLLVAALALIASPAMAQTPIPGVSVGSGWVSNPLPVRSLAHGLVDGGGTPKDLWTAGTVGAGGILTQGAFLTAEFFGPTTVSTFVYTMDTPHPTRLGFNLMDVYYDGVKVGQIQLKNAKGTQTVDLTQLDTTVKPTWVTCVLVSQHSTNPGVTSYSFEGTTVHTSVATTHENNVNLNYGKTATPGSPAQWSQSGVTDGNLTGGYDKPSVAWAQSGNLDRSVTVSYGKDVDGANISHYIGSIGISLMADNTDRVAPQYVIITGGTSAGQTCYEKVMLNEYLIQYNRYNLKALCWETNAVEWLKIEFPNGVSTGPGGTYFAAGSWVGLNEFQAFARVPEPMTMSLLALGGLAMLRRRRR